MTQAPRRFDQLNKFEHLNKSSNASEMLKLALLQLTSTIAFSVVMYFCYGVGQSLSAFYGGLIAALMSAFMATRMFTTHRLATIHDMPAAERLARFYVSVILKVLFTLMMMAIFIVVIKVSVLPFIIAYLIAAVIVNLLMLLVPSRSHEVDVTQRVVNPNE